MQTIVNARNVREYPELFSEELVPLCQASEHFPIPVSRQSIERFWRRGQKGVLLKTVKFVNKRFTSRQEIKRFLAASQNTGETEAAPARSTMPQKELAAKSQRFGLPEPINVSEQK